MYNNFPWPAANEKQITAIETAAQTVLDARAEYQTLPLADLYDPVAMPVELVKAHALLDKAVEKAYGVSGLASDNDRVAHLFERYLAAASVLDEGVAEKTTRRSKAEKV